MLQKEEIAREIAVRTGIPLKTAEDLVTAFVDIVHEAVASGKPVRLARIGKIGVTVQRGREYPDFAGGKKFIPTRAKVSFTPSVKLVREVRKLKIEDD